MQEVYTTSCIWMGAFFLTETSAKIDAVSISRGKRVVVSFSFRGENLSQLATGYSQQLAVANVSELRENLNFLRDIIFQSKKKEAGR